jgi:hypothetical protein
MTRHQSTKGQGTPPNGTNLEFALPIGTSPAELIRASGDHSEAAQTGRTHDCTDELRHCRNLLQGRSHPHTGMRRRGRSRACAIEGLRRSKLYSARSRNSALLQRAYRPPFAATGLNGWFEELLRSGMSLRSQRREFVSGSALRRSGCRALQQMVGIAGNGAAKDCRGEWRLQMRVHATRGRLMSKGLLGDGEGSISVPSHRAPLASKCLGLPDGKHRDYSALLALHQMRAVISSGEYRPRETTSGPHGTWASAQPSRITLKTSGKFRPQPDRENAFAGASGGGDGPDIQPSFVDAARFARNS